MTNCNNIEIYFVNWIRVGNACFYFVHILLTSGLLIDTLRLELRISQTMTLPVVSYGCETWSLTYTEEVKFMKYLNLRKFKNKVSRTIYGEMQDGIRGTET